MKRKKHGKNYHLRRLPEIQQIVMQVLKRITYGYTKKHPFSVTELKKVFKR